MEQQHNAFLHIINMLDDIFEKEPKHLFRSFQKKYIDSKSWCIASDYCLDDTTNKINNCFAYTLFPYIDLKFLQKKINEFLPKDLKDTKMVDEKIITILKEIPFFFNIVFIIEDKDFFLMDKSLKLNKKDVAQIQLEKFYAFSQKYAPKYALNIKSYLEETKKNKFSIKLYSNIFWNSLIASYLNNFIYKNTKKTNSTIWISDRDNMCNYCNKVLFNLYHINTTYLYHLNKLKIPKKNKIAVGIEGLQSFEFDEFIRIPDFLAGTIASIDFENKTINDNAKYLKLLNEAISDNSRLVIIKLFVQDEKIYCGKVKIKKK